MRKLVQFFIKQPIWANALIVITVLFGGYSLFKMNKSFFPELDPRTINISVMYPGASPEEMEDGITIKIEQALRGIDGIEELTSTSSENMASIRVKGYENADMDEVYKDVENAVTSINSFPQGAEKPIIRRSKSNPMSELVATLSLKGNDNLMVLKNEADKIENDLFASGLISIVELKGFPELELEVSVRESDLLKYGVLIDEISLALQRNNQDLTGGILRNEQEELIIRSRAKSTDPEVIEDIILRSTPEGDVITIGDVAEAKLSFSESSFEVFSEGSPAITMDIKKTPEQDLEAITDFVNNYIESYNKKTNKARLEMQYEYNASLQDRINLLTSNGIVGLILVLIMLGIFLSTRLSLWVAFGIPFSFLGMFIIANMLGLTINMISLFGMILVVGILVDDGIVIAENIYSHFEKGKSPFKAALDGTMEVMPSVFTSVLTTIAAFSILLFVDKMEMMREMPIVVILALGFSLIEAFIILPVHLASKKVLSKTKAGTFRFKVRSRVQNTIDFLREKVFEDVLQFVVKRYRGYVLAPLVFTVFVIVFSNFDWINYTFFPEIKPDRIFLEVSFEQGTGKKITRDWLLKAEDAIQEANLELAEATGDTLLDDYSVILGVSSSIGESGFHTGSITMVIDGEGKKTPVDSLSARIDKKVRQIENTKLATNLFLGSGFNNFGKPIEYSFTGNDDEQIRLAKDRFKEYLKDVPLVENVKDNEPLGRKEINLKMKPEAEFHGLGIFEVTKQVRQGVFGQEAQRVIIGTDEVKIWVRYAEEDRENQYDLNNMRIKSASGKKILLTELATYDIKRGPVSLKRRDGRREIIVDASVEDPTQVGSVNEKIVDDIIPKIKSEFPGIEIIQRGQGERSTKALNSMLVNVGILFIIMILIMSLNFNSVWQALLILLVVPAGVAGGILGHSIVGMPVSVLSAFGMIGLIGILINDSIVFLDTYNRNLLEGMKVFDAVIDAAKSRFRPILLTTVTTVAGLLPLILETSFQAQFLIPMAVSIAFGLLFGTVFILFFFPTIILVHNDMRRAWSLTLNPLDYQEETSGKGEWAQIKKSLPKLLKMTITVYLYILPIIFVYKGSTLLYGVIETPDLIEGSLFFKGTIGGIILTIGIIGVFFLPQLIYDRFLRVIWGKEKFPDKIEIEPVIMNRERQKERKVEA